LTNQVSLGYNLPAFSEKQQKTARGRYLADHSKADISDRKKRFFRRICGKNPEQVGLLTYRINR